MQESNSAGAVAVAMVSNGRGFTMALLFLLFAPFFCSAAGPEKVWSLRLRDVSGTPVGWTSHGVWGLAFSPDGSRLAIGFGDSDQRNIKRRLIVVPTADPKHVEMSFDADIPLYPFPWAGDPCCASFSWSPDGQYLAVYSGEIRDPWSFILNVKSGSHCSPEAARNLFLSSAAVLGLNATVDGVMLSVFTPKCEVTQGWQLHRGFNVEDASPETGLIAAVRYDPEVRIPERVLEGIILDSATLSTPTIKATLGPNFIPRFFIGGGNTVCGGRTYTELKCLVLSSGDEINVPVETGGIGRSKGAAARLVISEYRRHTMSQKIADFFDLNSLWFTFRRRVVWDVNQGQMVVHYMPETEHVKGANGRSVERFFGFAISPDGEHIAEGSPDSVTLYKIH
jgi:hypothetical protein